MTQNSINNSASELQVDNLNLDGNTLSSTDTNGNIVLAPDGSGVVSVTAAPIVPSTDRADSLGSTTNSWDNVYADGISFDDGTNVLGNFTSSTAWTPSLFFGGGSTGITYSSRTGTYSRVGRLFFFRMTIVLTSKGTSTGNVSITGLPANPSSFTAAYLRIGTALSFSGVPQVGISSGGVLILEEVTTGGSRSYLTNADFANNTEIQIAGSFLFD